MAAEWLDAMFASIDAKDTEGFLRHLTADARFRYGSNPPVSGAEAIGQAVSGFFGMIAGCTHRPTHRWLLPDVAIIAGEVTYVRLDGREVTVPFADILHTRGDRVHDYVIYIDPAPLFAP